MFLYFPFHPLSETYSGLYQGHEASPRKVPWCFVPSVTGDSVIPLPYILAYSNIVSSSDTNLTAIYLVSYVQEIEKKKGNRRAHCVPLKGATFAYHDSLN